LFYPYYALLALCGLYHGLNGLAIALSVFGWPLPQAVRTGPGFWLPMSAAAGLLLAGVLALGGQLFEIPDPRANDFARLLEELGVADLSH
jgi:succinate dehydrogenase/fumarate reductase cytochrome b subunit